ncbi:hypothetical protein SCUCBS95973_004734 [Sporothrix curviconia]|uniref:Uncharacterized protein n=1 Tax=Sporothrix curviconia TaxID=1260050 RepID=A0ABP0BR93_9PEZI
MSFQFTFKSSRANQALAIDECKSLTESIGCISLVDIKDSGFFDSQLSKTLCTCPPEDHYGEMNGIFAVVATKKAVHIEMFRTSLSCYMSENARLSLVKLVESQIGRLVKKFVALEGDRWNKTEEKRCYLINNTKNYGSADSDLLNTLSDTFWSLGFDLVTHHLDLDVCPKSPDTTIIIDPGLGSKIVINPRMVDRDFPTLVINDHAINNM